MWLCDRLPCWRQGYGPSHAREHEALLPRRANRLTVDGEFDVSDLEKQYDLIAVRIPELGCEMLKLISGNDRAKHAALWEGRLNITSGSIRTRLSGEILLHRSALAWIFRFFGAEFPFRRTPQRCRYGCRIFCFDPPKLHRFDPDFEWRGTLIQLWYICLPAECNPIRRIG